jgi:hypothetical protein
MALRVNKSARRSKTVVLNRKALTALGEGIADGFIAVAERALELAAPNVPDAPPYGVGLVKTGAYVVYANGRKVGGKGSLRRKEKKGIVMYAGYGFPMHLYELGSVHQPPRPVFAPAFFQATRDITPTVKPFVQQALGQVRSDAT